MQVVVMLLPALPTLFSLSLLPLHFQVLVLYHSRSLSLSLSFSLSLSLSHTHSLSLSLSLSLTLSLSHSLSLTHTLSLSLRQSFRCRYAYFIGDVKESLKFIFLILLLKPTHTPVPRELQACPPRSRTQNTMVKSMA